MFVINQVLYSTKMVNFLNSTQRNYTTNIIIYNDSLGVQSSPSLNVYPSPPAIINNQSRSRKPFNLSYSQDSAHDMLEHVNCNLMSIQLNCQKEIQNKHILMENTTTSFDDLDTVEEINLNQHSLTKLRQTNQPFERPPVINRVLRQSPVHSYNGSNSHTHPYFFSGVSKTKQAFDSNEFQPTSILKRIDSSKKMIQSSSCRSIEGSTLPKNFTINESTFIKSRTGDNVCSDIYERSFPNQTVRKRVQFANIPSMLSSASSDGDLSNVFNRSTTRPKVRQVYSINFV